MVNWQWNIYWADLNPAIGSEQSGRRPVLVVSADEANEFLPVVTILSLTSMKPGRKIYPTEVLLSAQDTQLPVDSIAMAHQIRSIPKNRLSEQCACIQSIEHQMMIRRAIALYLDLN